MTIDLTYDSSFNNLTTPQKTQIQAALNTVVTQYDSAISNPITVNIQIGWGSANGSSLPSGTIGYTLDATNATTYSQMQTYLATFGGVLPTNNPTGVALALPTAEGKALGLVSASNSAIDGYIGFSSTASWTYTDSGNVPAGTYDLLGVAKQEIGHVLGRISGLTSGTVYDAYPFDLFRYSGKGITTFTYGTAAYASVDGGATSLGKLAGSLDPSDWAGNGGASGEADNVTPSPGQVLTLSPQDLGVFHALGYIISGNPDGLDSTAVTPYGATAATTPEPAGLSVLALGGLMLLPLRRRRGQTNPVSAA